MSRSERLSLIDSADEEVSVKQQCQWLGISRSSFYYRPSGIPEADYSAMRALDELYLDDPTRGTRRMCKELRKLGFVIGRSHTRKFMQRMRLRTIYCRPRTTCIDPAAYKFPYLLRNLDITRSNQVWAADITYIPMARGYMYLFAIMDVKSRFIVGWSLSNTMDTDWIVKTISKAINRYGVPDIINTDQGSQFTSEAYVNYINNLKHTQISMDGKGRALDNIFNERFWRTIKHEKIYLVRPENGHQAEKACREFIDYYNSRREHSSLGDKVPEKVYLHAA